MYPRSDFEQFISNLKWDIVYLKASSFVNFPELNCTALVFLLTILEGEEAESAAQTLCS